MVRMIRARRAGLVALALMPTLLAPPLAAAAFSDLLGVQSTRCTVRAA